MAKQRAQRQRELSRIHCLGKELALDDATYRSMLWTVARVQSSSKLDSHGRQQVIEHMQSRKAGGRRQPTPGADRAAQVAKIEAQKNALGVGDRYVDGIARRMFGVANWRWCSPDQLRKLTAALWYSQRRRGRTA